MSGTFITFEGLDGAGKTTQIQRLAQHFEAEGREVLVTREPGGTLLGEQVRGLVLQQRDISLDPYALMLLFASSFAQKWAEVIGPALDQGKVVLSDRWYSSTIAYQSAGGGLDPQYVRDTCLNATGQRMPDATFFFDLESAERNRRLAHRGAEKDAIEAKGDEFYAKVRQGFLNLVVYKEFSLIDANGSPDEVFERLLHALKKRAVFS